MTETYNEPWSNSACLGYVITAMENLGYEPDKIIEVTMELKELFDWLSVEDAEEACSDSGYDR